MPLVLNEMPVGSMLERLLHFAALVNRLRGELKDKDDIIDGLQTQVKDKDAMIDSLRAQLAASSPSTDDSKSG
ncbi:uncharacterized protein J3D65DRAFT_679324 [Phyllosticta citribraziliensis]|uniref:Uncharacterized protein n=1 Tax=Phyllosticta citribraziliensis TaxID=989973 RepID=A0ABR1LC28_9PEZI